jgi:hypothetical protein
MMIGKIWYNPGVEDKCYLFLVCLDNLDDLLETDNPRNTLKGIETDIAVELYQINRNRYPRYVV